MSRDSALVGPEDIEPADLEHLVQDRTRRGECVACGAAPAGANYARCVECAYSAGFDGS